MKRPTKLNLLVEDQMKKKAFKIASNRGISISRLFEVLIEAEGARE